MQKDVPPEIPGIRFISVAGRGGMSIVWRAWHERLGREVAVKVMDEAFSRSARDVRQFMVESRTMEQLVHPNIVHAMEADCKGGMYYFVMDFVGGYTMGQLLSRKGKISESDSIMTAGAVADALSYAWHSYGMVHCDIKPDNIMVDIDGTVKLMDLGLCRAAGISHANVADDEVVGTPAYISPEQIFGDVELDCRSDIYSLGATLYHFVAGRMMYPGLSNDDTLRAHADSAIKAPDPRKFTPALSEGFVRVLEKSLAVDRKERYPGWEEFLADVAAVDNGIMPMPFSGNASSLERGV